MMMYKRDLSSIFASLDKPIIAYSGEFGTSSHSIFVEIKSFQLSFYFLDYT